MGILSLEIELLKTFQRVAALGSITKSADDLYLSVSTVTARIKSLEQEVGKQLFVRTGRRIELTETGQYFLRYVNRFVALIEEGCKRVQFQGRPDSGDLNFASTPIVTNYILPRLLRRFHDEYPMIRLKLSACPNAQVLDLIVQGKAEIGMIQEDLKEDGLNVYPWFKDSVIPVFAKGHPLSKRATLTPDDIAPYPVLAFERQSDHWGRITKWFSKQGIVPRILMEFDQDGVETLKRFLEHFEAISFLPYITVAEELESGELATIGLSPALKLQWSVYVAVRSDSPDLSGAAHAFLEFASHLTNGGVG